MSERREIRRRKVQPGYPYRRRSKVNLALQFNADLQHVLGLTVKSNCSLSCDPNTGLLAYPAGCVIVLYNPRNGKQTPIHNPGNKNITCLRFSCDGTHIATGESGHQPCVRVFSVADRSQIIAFDSHKYGISCVTFSPNMKYVVSVGFQHDQVINVWDWKNNSLAASNKVSTKIKSVAFSHNNNYFVTVGNRHVKFWYMEPTPDKCTLPIKGRSAILESYRNQLYCDVTCGLGSDDDLTFAITRSGILCQFNARRTVEKSIQLKNGNGKTLTTIPDMVVCGGSSGSILVFSSSSLLPLHILPPPATIRAPEILANTIDIRSMWMHTIFADHSLLVYDIMDFSSPQTHALSTFHSSSVWDIKIVPDNGMTEVGDCFITCSNDGSVHVFSSSDKSCECIRIIELESPTKEKLEARSICVRHDGMHLAVGDKAGNIHVYDLVTFQRVCFTPTHEGDILSVDYSMDGGLLASASRDRCVHLFGAGYAPTHTIADHSAAVTSVKFASHKNEFRLLTCGADKSLYFCGISATQGRTEVSREQHVVEKHSMNDMEVLDDSVLVACGSNLIEFDVIGGKQRRSFRANESAATILRVAVDNQRTIIAASCADKNIYLLAYLTGECTSAINGHSEVAVSLTFHHDLLISASADSCIFVWHITHDARTPGTPGTPGTPDLDKTQHFADDTPTDTSFFQHVQPCEVNGKHSDSEEFALPNWVTGLNSDPTSLKPVAGRGKWGERIHDKVLDLGNILDKFGEDSPLSDDDSADLELPSESYNVTCDYQLGDPSETYSPRATFLIPRHRTNSVDRSTPGITGITAPLGGGVELDNDVTVLDTQSIVSSQVDTYSDNANGNYDSIMESNDVTIPITTSITQHNDVIAKTGDVIISQKDVTNKTDDVTTKTDDVTIANNEVTIQTADLTIKTNDVTDDITIKTDDVTIKADDVTIKADDVIIKADDVTIKVDDVTIKADDVTTNSDDVTIQVVSNMAVDDVTMVNNQQGAVSDAQEKSISVAHKKTSSDAHKKSNSDAHEKTSSDAHKKSSSDAHEKTISDAHKKSSSDAHEKTSSDAHEKTISDAHKKFSSDAHEKANSDAHDKTSSDAQEKFSSDAHEKSSSDAHEKSSSDAHEKYGSDAHEKSSSDAHEKYGSDAHEKSGSYAQESTSSDAHDNTSNNTSSDALQKTSNNISSDALQKTSNNTSSDALQKTNNNTSSDAHQKTSNNISSDAHQKTSNNTSSDAHQKTSNNTSSDAHQKTSNNTSSDALQKTCNNTSSDALQKTNNNISSDAHEISSSDAQTEYGFEEEVDMRALVHTKRTLEWSFVPGNEPIHETNFGGESLFNEIISSNNSSKFDDSLCGDLADNVISVASRELSDEEKILNSGGKVDLNSSDSQGSKTEGNSPKQGMPPAFAELLATLTKKKPIRGNSRLTPRTPPKTLRIRKKYDSGDSGGYRGKPPEPPTTHEEGYNQYYDDCQTISDDLIKVFNKAEAVYHKQKDQFRLEPNGNVPGYQKIARTFQTLHGRITRMGLHNNLDNLSAESPVYNLLREYSDKLVELVQLNVAPDTV